MTRQIPRIAWLQLAANVILFGLSWPIIKIGLEASTPLWFAAARATLSATTAFVLLACLGRLAWPHRADWPIVLSVGALQLSCFFAFSNLGMQSLPAGRSSVFAYTAMLWVVPLSLMVGEKVGWRAVAGVLLGLAGIVVLVEPLRFDWNDRAIIWGHVWLLLAGFTWAIAIVHIRRHRWKLTPLDALPWQMSVATVLLWVLALIAEPAGHLELDRKELWMSLLYIGAFAGPIATWAAVSVGRALPPVVGSMGMLGVPLLSIASSVVLLGETITAPLAIGTALVIAGIAIVILDRSRD
ncbi:MAG: DMT family transporter [Reyranella sp.]|uniref:DMT family transporter n=1 Tax=Reyranella sp. TaxID=1929291 RepID=UPI00272F4D95|nr:DMT family transporter [Reyranella sp.]MDP1964243.1 DMT family transporter [Reyranella sp.]MDP2378510.1 DMT family transporter [Reyranella sp.]